MREPRLLFELLEHVGADGSFQLRRRNLFVGAGLHPGIGYLALAILVKPLQELANSSIEQTPDSTCAEHAAQVAKQSPERLLSTPAGWRSASRPCA